MPRHLQLTDPTRRSWAVDEPRPVRITVWEPEQALHAPVPLALLSHGTGGSVETLDWLGEALSAAGWLVVGVDHHGNTSAEPYLPQGFGFIWERPKDLRYALNWAMAERAVDASRIAAVGYSLGGYSVAALAGARLNTPVVRGVLSGQIPVPPLPEYPTLVEDLAAAYSSQELATQLDAADADLRDPRVNRVVLLAPAVGQLVAADTLAHVRVPALVMWGANDDIAAPAQNAHVYRNGIPDATGVELGAYDHGIFRSDVAEPSNGRDIRAAVAQRIVGFLRG